MKRSGAYVFHGRYVAPLKKPGRSSKSEVTGGLVGMAGAVSPVEKRQGLGT
jgi:hypothetical protein